MIIGAAAQPVRRPYDGHVGSQLKRGSVRSKEEHTEAIHRDRRVCVVVNTHSRRGRRHYVEVLHQLHDLGFEPLATFAVVNTKRLRQTLDKALELEPDLLIVGGGDGTLSSAVRHVALRDVALGVLPLGTTNNFARSLGLPLDLAGALGVFAAGKVADIDLGMANDRPFANLASFGVSVEVAGTVRPWLKRLLGRAAYPLTALRVLPRHRPFRAFITTDGGKRHELLTHQLNIANGRFHGGWQVAKDISIDNGMLVAYQLGSGKKLRLLMETMARASTGRWRSLAGGPFVTGREMLLEVPNGVRVMVPSEFEDQ